MPQPSPCPVKHAIRIGAGAGFSGDRIEPAVELIEHARLDYIGFECLAERTIGLAQAARRSDPQAGFDPLLRRRMGAVLRPARERGVRIITNMGAANPVGAAAATASVARELGLRGLRIAAVTGDDVLDVVRAGDYPLLEQPGSSRDLLDRIVSANAYLGTAGIVAALGEGADVVITGRGCDAALFLAPLIHEFGWPADDWDRLASGTLVGHLLECAGQLTGGYFADPGFKDVPDLARLGFPYAEVRADGSAVFAKVDGSGGRLDEATSKEQLLYEVLDPGAYLQADVTADFRNVTLAAAGPDRVRASGARGEPPPDTLKVSLSYDDGYVGQGQISFAGPGARARAELAFAIVRERLHLTGVAVSQLSLELLGINALDRTGSTPVDEPLEVTARISGRANDSGSAQRIGEEVEALYTNGPAGGGGACSTVRRTLAVASILLPRQLARADVRMQVV